MTRIETDLPAGFALADGRLYADGQAIPLTPTLYAVLRHFALNPDRLITKQELLDQVWPGTHVTEGLVKDYVRKVRRVLDDDPKRPRFIETARGMGYRFVGKIDVSAVDSTTVVAAPIRPSVPSVAVLPFADMSVSADQAYFAAGIAEDIMADLSRFRSLIVIARDSSFLYGARPPALSHVAGELDVQYLVQGSVRKADNRVRIHAQLIEAASGAVVWAEHYDRDLGDVFDVQDDVSRAIVSTLVGHLEAFNRQRAARKRPDSLEVYDCLLLGDWHLRQGSKEDILKAREMFHRAMELEPTNARAHAEMAFSYLIEFSSNWTASPETAVDKAFDLASNATALDDRDSRAHLYLATAYHYGKLDFETAELEYDRAIKLNPNDYDVLCLRSWLLALSGRTEQGITCAEQAIRLSPLTTEDCRVAQCFAAYNARRYGEALAALGSIIEPTNEVKAFRAMCYAQLGRDTDARTAMSNYLVAAQSDIADYPGMDHDRWQRYWAVRYPFKRAEDFEHFLDGLQKAGLP